MLALLLEVVVEVSLPVEVRRSQRIFFPGVSAKALAAAVARYQDLGCWAGGTAIPRDLYEQAQDVFESAGEISRRYPYEAVCLSD